MKSCVTLQSLLEFSNSVSQSKLMSVSFLAVTIPSAVLYISTSTVTSSHDQGLKTSKYAPEHLMFARFRHNQTKFSKIMIEKRCIINILL